MSDSPLGPFWWQASDGKWYPPEQAPSVGPVLAGGAAAPNAQGVLVTVGDIGCTQDEIITPNGRFPLRNSTWIVTNQTQVVEKIPTYAIILAIVFALLCLIGLLFLLIKERTFQGFMQVSVQGPNLYYATQVPISHQTQVLDVEQRVNYIRGLVAALGPAPS
jgi:hypothetical protein